MCVYIYFTIMRSRKLEYVVTAARMCERRIEKDNEIRLLILLERHQHTNRYILLEVTRYREA